MECGSLLPLGVHCFCHGNSLSRFLSGDRMGWCRGANAGTAESPKGMKATHPSISQISGFPPGVPTPKNTYVKKRCHSYKSPLQFFSGEMTFLQNKFLDEVWKYESNKNPSVIVEWGRRGLVTPLQGSLVMVTLKSSLDIEGFT